MARERLSMRKIKEVLRLRALGLTGRQIAASAGVARSTVSEYLKKADAAGLSWPQPEGMDDAALIRRLFPPGPASQGKQRLPDYGYIHTELKKKGVTLRLLWEEYLSENPEGYRYTQFCHYYHRYKGKLNLSMRQVHRAGEKMFVDFAGQTMPVVDRYTGAVREAEVFVAVLGASSYTYACAVWSQELDSWIDCHRRAFEFFGGVPRITVPDNLKSGISKPCRYEPDLNPTYLDMAEHYQTAVIPARVRSPRDKAKVEAAVLVAERWILAALRNHTFFSLAELNQKIAELLKKLNSRPFAKLDGTRSSLFETLDVPALLPLPKIAYEFARFKKATVNIDYHVDVYGHYYSVPYPLVKEKVDVRITTSTVEILYKGKRIASHLRSLKKGAHTTQPEHMPARHRQYLEWTPTRIIDWAGAIGPNLKQLTEAILTSKKHPEQGYRAALGLIRLAKTYPKERLEAAAGRAFEARALSYKSVKLMLKNNLEALPIDSQQSLPIVSHKNIRGADYYQVKEITRC